jgi:hypothetical protein
MKLHHAAALALVGWYLMLPPLRPDGPRSDPPKGSDRVKADLSAPLSQWEAISTGKPFGTKKECEAYPEHLKKLLHDPKKPGAERALKYWFDRSQCVSTDDPRMKSRAEVK